ncbi:ECF transporter S component [Lacticaseibacillus hulanensis]|uniref:ECF transporter S component n=1 Tax=Lacticaseibacillus hulanensis TaxID=2493111 RepID=UPI000FDA27E8|nr:ECF transporter S component [Lacticaseibacillus hulanensis]
MNRSRSKAYRISIIGLLTALIIVQSFVPMIGYISLGAVSITTIHLTVIIGAVMLGTSGGAELGLIWGITSMIVAYTTPADPLSLLLFRNPIIAIVPRVMTGVVAGLIFNQIKSSQKTGSVGTIKMIFSGIAGALTNTALVIAFTWLFYASKAATLVGNGASSANLGWVMMAMLGVNAIAEAIAGGIVTPLLGQALIRFRRD